MSFFKNFKKEWNEWKKIDGSKFNAEGWKKIKHPSEVLKKKDKISSAVLSIDKENCRISLGIKQLLPDPWDEIAGNYPIGTEVSGKIIKVTGFGAFAEFGDGLEGLIHVSQLSSKNI